MSEDRNTTVEHAMERVRAAQRGCLAGQPSMEFLVAFAAGLRRLAAEVEEVGVVDAEIMEEEAS